MSVRVMGKTGNVLGILELPSTILLIDLEVLRRLGAHRIELVALKTNDSGD